MFATRREQENVVHNRQLSKTDGGKPLAPKTPHQTSKTPFRGKQGDENLVNKKTEGKVKGAVAVLEAKSSTTSFCTPAGPRLRVPLGTKTGNVKGVFQTPANLLTAQRQVHRGSSPRVRKPKFLVHDGETDVAAEPEVREIEFMHPREDPLPDIPDEDIWQQDRTYSQLQGKNFTKDWAVDLYSSDNESFDTKLRRFEEADAKRKKILARPETISSVKAASALSSVRGVGNFASATSSSAARAVKKPSGFIRTRPSNPRHIVAKTLSNTTLGYSKGRRVSANALSETSDSGISEQDRRNILQNMWQYSSDEAELDELPPQPIDVLELEKLRDLDISSIPDD